MRTSFTPAADPDNMPLQQMARLEADLLARFQTKLDTLLQAPALDNSEDWRHHGILRQLDVALSNGTVETEWDNVMALSAAAGPHAFREALVRVRADDGTIRPDNLFAALEYAGPDVATSFRAWLVTSQIRSFQTSGHSGALSVNIVPSDMDNAHSRAALDETLRLAKLSAYGSLILEATEDGVWTELRRAALTAMAREHGVKIAVDDYGAPKGCNDAKMLAALARDLPPGHLLVKLDGQMIKNFRQQKDRDLIDRLREIKTICPDAPVIAEWISSAGHARALKDDLRPHALADAIDLIQSRALVAETPESFLAKLAAMDHGRPAPGAAPSNNF